MAKRPWYRRMYVVMLRRMEETSTTRGLIGAAILIGGWSVDPSRIDAWTTLAVFVSAILKLALPDKWTKDDADSA
jgi:hypothetical protein